MAQRSRPLVRQSIRGITHDGVRWKIVSRCTSGWIAGMNWSAEAPLPITATRRPRSDRSWRQFDEWNSSPRKLDRPGRSGISGSCSGPAATMKNRALMRPSLVSSSHRRDMSSQRASSTSVPSRRCGGMPNRSARSVA